MAQTYNLILKISRYDPDTQRSWVQGYPVQAGEVLRFVDVLRMINEDQDSTLTWSSSCEHGMCGSCAVRVNGKPVLACELLVGDAVEYFKTYTFTIKPLTIAPVLRDLVVDLETAYERVRVIKPYIIQAAPVHPEGDEYRIPPGILQIYESATRCINCFCCAQACISRPARFLGPNAMLSEIVRLMDHREMARDERMAILYGDRGVSRCHTSRACSHVCPKQIDVAHFMALAKESKFILNKRDIAE
ncbi:MAG: succinate dehydrogenase/fumarate reductase iron-sulfur subunit [Desulfobacterales bacterium]|nr:MAG: succinate dehydrogenase/fumarate reductase iron-sulfur subunit [Desulfobacterales bacterium]